MVALVCGVRTEAPVGLLIEALAQRRADFVVLDQRELVDTVALRWSIGPEGFRGMLRAGDRVIDLDEVSAAYVRFMSVEQMPERAGRPHDRARTRGLVQALVECLEASSARVVNRRRPMMSNNSKPYQALLIRRAGFRIPDTLVSNRPDRVVDFSRQVGPLIYKSSSSERSIVRTLDVDDVERLSKVRALPTQFQRQIDGFGVRVHVVGSQCFAAKIVSPSTDYRYGDEPTITPYALCEDLRRRCLDLAHALEMSFVGIDLIVAEDDVYCLEVNPSPAYNFYQDRTGSPISHALAAFLAEAPQDAAPRQETVSPDIR